MLGIDVSVWNGWPYNPVTQSAFDVAKFVIVKATEGTGYVNQHCDKQYQHAKANGKLLGTYHYANGGSPAAEARYYYDNIKGYIGEAIPCLDWESGGNAAWGSTTWAYDFCEKFHQLSGVWPMIYVQASALNQVRKCSSKCALWVAGYPTNEASWTVPPFPYDVSGWAISVWQFSSGGGIDRNYSQLTAAQWKAIANGDKKRPTYAAKNLVRENTYQALQDMPVRRGHAKSANIVGQVKKGELVKFLYLHRNSTGIWYGKLDDARWVAVKDSWTGEAYFRKGAVVKSWKPLKKPIRKALEGLTVYDKPSTKNGKKLATIKRGSLVEFDYAKRNFYGNIWGRIAEGKNKGRWVIMKSGKSGWKVSQ